MTINVTGMGTGLSGAVAGEIRAWMGRRGLRQSDLARALGVNEQWLSTRLRGNTPLGLNDVDRIADVLGVTVVDLLPRDRRAVTETFPPDRVTPGPVRTMKPDAHRLNRRPADRRPVGYPANRSHPDGSRRAQRIA